MGQNFDHTEIEPFLPQLVPQAKNPFCLRGEPVSYVYIFLFLFTSDLLATVHVFCCDYCIPGLRGSLTNRRSEVVSSPVRFSYFSTANCKSSLLQRKPCLNGLSHSLAFMRAPDLNKGGRNYIRTASTQFMKSYSGQSSTMSKSG